MAKRKLVLTAAQKIKGLRKALSNPRTPKQFRASLKKRLAALLILIVAISLHGQSAHYRALSQQNVMLPDANATPGAVRPDATTEKVCHGGSTKQYRHTTAAMKAAAYAAYGAKKIPGTCCEVDHLIPLELGGADDPKNLWPQPYLPKPGAHEKDQVEQYLHRQVCAGVIPLADAQHAIAENWWIIYDRMPASEKAK